MEDYGDPGEETTTAGRRTGATVRAVAAWARKRYRVVEDVDTRLRYYVTAAEPHIAIPHETLRPDLLDDYSRETGADLPTLIGERVEHRLTRERRRAKVSRRWAEHTDDDGTRAVYIDLAPAPSGAVTYPPEPEREQVIRVTSRGWAKQDSAPVIFARSDFTAPHAVAAAGDDHQGSLERVRAVLGMERTAWRLGVAWALTAMVPWVEVPALCMTGPEGSGKTTVARVLGDLASAGPVAPP
ncbi:hypothetical protein [Arsenicicoccus dermatophilus]|uniref:hypothetical protein n=1 Tax=Arsenicicoccus dermatophilus TaxID=1076331 RepID=UPI001F4D27C4|nr:hypothetical protein [Arsenicicoccus dermatophilus]MCH8614479.1 hypothetical protein [Arsenicicoccus dermatophilus]